MKALFTILALLVLPFVQAHAQAQAKGSVLRVFDMRSQSGFDEQTAKVLRSELAACKDCSFENLTKYDALGKAILPLDPATAWGPAQELSKNTDVLFINWNTRMKKGLAPWVNYLSAFSGIVIFAAGEPESGEDSAPLGQTLAGKISQSVIVGELGERDRLWGASFFGPEMFTAIRPPKDWIGQHVAPVFFAAKLTKAYAKRKDWLEYFKDKKKSNRKIWLELRDIFN